jgi:hypothetical protein
MRVITTRIRFETYITVSSVHVQYLRAAARRIKGRGIVEGEGENIRDPTSR